MVNLTDDMISDILEQDLAGTWQRYKVLCIDYEQLENEMRFIKYGYDLSFSLNDVLKHRYVEKPKQGLITIGKNTITLQDFEDELDKRESMMKKLIIDTVQTQKILKGRLEA